MDKTYKPQNFETKIYKSWERSKAFIPKRLKKRTPFSLIMPPPNANAPLHIGHAMFVTLEDILTRYHRMKGSSSLWLPGADHAGILTQVVFERKLAKKGKTRFDLGRKKFYQECLKFTLENKKIMFGQIKKMGASCDWSRQKFTLDKNVSQQVLKTFVSLYKNGLAYRGNRLINWCPRCMTALSDLEVEHRSVKTKLWFIKYPLKQLSGITGEQRFLIVATTRPETMLGDTALAVNSKDKRYQKFIGQTIILPILRREIPIVADKLVDPEFGTGVVKVTPAHDPVDWEIGQNHKLAVIKVVDFDGKMTKQAGKDFAGLTTFKARKKITEHLNRKNFLIKERNYYHSVGHCERCKTIVEPLMSKQWFLNVKKDIKLQKKLQTKLGLKKASLKKLGLTAVKKDLIKIKPKRFKKNYQQWMENLKDWCISRQLWWGQQLPIWYCGLSGLSSLQKNMNPDLIEKISNKRVSNKKKQGCGHVLVALKKPKQCPKCKNSVIIQDPDTFDTWFSSGQWPYTTLGYPQNKDYKYWYPTTIMETGYEILYTWVARMIFLGLYRTADIPFRLIYLHGMVRDAFGEKMSKSKGNVIDPLDVIQKYGADALRMALIVGASPGNDISVSEDKIKGYRNFTNKVWNIGRFIKFGFKSTKKHIPWYKNSLENLTSEDKQIIKKLNRLIKNQTKLLDNYKFSPAGKQLYKFIWHEFADNYIEYTKCRLDNQDVIALSVLRHIYINCLKLLHPFMPFVTEAVWKQFPSWHKALGLHEKQIITSKWPSF
jgi:valyl-tRNA synthetase